MRAQNDVFQERLTFEADTSKAVDTGLTGPVAATGTLTCVANASMADGDYVTIGDGINPAILFEYDKSADGVTSGRTSWAAGASSATDVAVTLKNAINTAMPALLATNVAGVVTVTHRWPGAGGNITITENVANAGFLVTGMSGGADSAANASASLTATTTVKLFKCKDRSFRLDRAFYNNPTGFAADPTDYWTVAVLKGTTVMASWSTLSTAQGALTADTPVNLVLSATDANTVADDGDVISMKFTKTGSPAALPPGRLVLEGRYL